jgi:hypothetical protein
MSNWQWVKFNIIIYLLPITHYSFKRMKDLLEKIIDVPSPFNSKMGKVVAIDTDARTCDIEPLDGTASVFDVKLQAFEKSVEGVVLFPKMDSIVVVTMLSNESGYVSLTSEVDNVQFKKEGVDLAKELDKIFDLTDALIDVLTKFQLNTSMGVTLTVMPNIITELQKIKQKNGAIKSQINKIIK